MAALFTTFNFEVSLNLPGQPPFCEAHFSECNGLELSMSPKTIREGGNNGRQIHLAGPVTYGQLSLKRGMTNALDLWEWFGAVQRNRRLRAAGQVRMLNADRSVALVFKLTGCLPIKLRAPSLSGKDGQIAIEEMQIAYEHLSLPKGS